MKEKRKEEMERVQAMERYKLGKSELVKIREESGNDMGGDNERNYGEDNKQGGRGKDKEDTRFKIQYI